MAKNSSSSSSNTSNQSILRLATEVFHLIFDYLDSKTILETIGCTCEELHGIVNCYNRLKLDFSRHFQVNSFFSLYKVDQLKALKLTCPKGEEFDQFIAKIIQHRVKFFSIVFPYQSVDESHRMINILSSIILPCNLEHLHLDISGKVLTNDIVLKSVEVVLRSLKVVRCTFEEYHRILSSCTNLQTLIVEFFTCSTTALPPVTLPDCRLTSLTLDAYSLSMDELYSVLSCASSLVHLHVTIGGYDWMNMPCGDSLEKFITTRLLHLKTFQFLFRCRGEENFGIPLLRGIIKSFQTPFWLEEKQWIVHCDYVFESSIVNLYTSSSLTSNENVSAVRCTNFSSSDEYQLIIGNHRSDRVDQQKCTTLDLRGARLTDTGAFFLNKVGKKNTMLKTLKCRNECMSMTGINQIADLIQTSQTLTTLDYQCQTSDIRRSEARMHSRNGINSNDWSFSSSRMKTSTRCHLGGEPLDFRDEGSMKGGIRPDREVEHIAVGLVGNKVLKVLSLRSSEITKRGAEHLAYALQRNSTLITLDCRRNEIGSEGTKYLAKTLKTNSALTTLNLSLNWIKPPGIQDLADALKINTTLTTLDFQHNFMDSCATKHLADALTINRALTTLIVTGNGIDSDGIKDLAEALQINNVLTTIDLGDNQIDPIGAQHLAKLLRNNQTLLTLLLENNSIRDQGAEHLAQALQINKTLKTLNLSANDIGTAGAEHVLKALGNNRMIITLQLEENSSIDQNLLDLLNRSIERNKEFLRGNSS